MQNSSRLVHLAGVKTLANLVPSKAHPTAPSSAATKASAAALSTLVRSVAQPFAEVGPESNLKFHTKFKKTDLARGAMFFYANRVKFTNRKTAFIAYGSLAGSIVFPGFRQIVPSRMQAKSYAKIWSEISIEFTAKKFSSLASVKKESDHFLVKAPVFGCAGSKLAGLMNGFYSDPKDRENKDVGHDPELLSMITSGQGTKFIPSSQIKDTGGIFSKFLSKLKQVEGSGVEIRMLMDHAVFFLVLRFTEFEASVMCQTPWSSVRPMDFYGMILSWSRGRMGVLRSALYSIPLTTIARTLPAGGKPRVSDDLGIMVDEKATYWALPKEHNKVGDFDAQQVAYLRRPDGSFCAFPNPDEDPQAAAPHPSSGLVFLDWINMKMAYTGEEGQMIVASVDRAMAAHVGHYRRIVDLRLNSEEFVFMYNRSRILAEQVIRTSIDLLPKEMIDFLTEMLKHPTKEGMDVTDLTVMDVYQMAAIDPACGQLWDIWKSILDYSDNSIENLYARYSFSTISPLLAYLKIAVKCCSQREQIKAADMERLKAYEDQNPIKDYELPTVPYVAEERALQPHQARTASRMRGSPKFAILAVDAGGGKTISCIFDYLKEMKLGNVRRGLILCPAHLVGQYVREFLYFTDSRVNVIAINTYSLKTHGLEGIQRMIQAAPPNTVVVTDYNLALGGMKNFRIGYGTATTSVYPLVDLLRRFSFDYVFCDESHYLSHTTSRQQAVARLTADIPYKRLASGTLTPNNITDLIAQVALLDPTIFPKNEFIAKFAVKMRGDKVVEWKKGYATEIMRELKNHVVFAQVKRKEWAAWLPLLTDAVIFVQLSPAQQEVYNTILEEIVGNIERAMAEDKVLRKLLTGKGEDGEEDTEAEVDMDQLLKPYLARLEKFVAAPGKDVLGATMLKGADLVSPKLGETVNQIREHLERIAGEPPEVRRKQKILIFCNYLDTATEIYENFPEDIKKMAIHYTAGEKEVCGSRFEHDDSKMVMIGVEQSMNTGLNLQFCSVLLRLDAVWTPGAMEQGDSRIQRPNIKAKESRSKIYIFWITCQNTIDVTKLAYLRTKKVTIGKFEEEGNPRFDRIDAPALFPMSLDVIRESGQAGSQLLDPIQFAYEQFRHATFAEYNDYRRKNMDEAGPDGTPIMRKIERSPNDPEAKLMYRVPYVAGTDLYGAHDLGLLRYDEFMRVDADEFSEDEAGGDDDAEDDDSGESDVDNEDGVEDLSTREKSKRELETVRGMPVHTEYGEGVIIGVSRKRVTVQMNDGTKVRVNKLAAFIVTRKQTSNADMRQLLLRQIGDVPFDVPPQLAASAKDPVRVPKKKSEEPEPTGPQPVQVALQLIIVNDVVGLEFSNATENPEGAMALESLGFLQPEPFYYAEMPTPQHMYNQFAKWHAAGFTFRKGYNEACRDLYIALKNARANAVNLVGIASQVELTNFFRDQRRPYPSKTELSPYPIVKDNKVFIALPGKGHPASQAGIRVRAPGIAWKAAQVDDIRQVFMQSLQRLDQNMHKLLNENLQVTNIKELRTRRAKLQRRSPGLYKGLV